MITTVQEGLERYKQALREYKEYTDKLKNIHGKELMEKFGTSVLDTGVWIAVEKRSAQIRGMANALGLTKEEEAAIDLEIGIAAPQVATEMAM